MAYWIMAKSEGVSRNLQVFYYFCECSHRSPLLSNLWGDCNGCEIYWKWEEKLDLGRHKFTWQFATSAVKPARMGTALVRTTLGSQHAAPIIKKKLWTEDESSWIFFRSFYKLYKLTDRVRNPQRKYVKSEKKHSALEKKTLLSKSILSRGN